jgi:hypothetical protein
MIITDKVWAARSIDIERVGALDWDHTKFIRIYYLP